MKKVIVVKWIEDWQKHVKEIDRQEMLDKFRKLAEEYQDNNEISLKLIKIIPTAQWILIQKDHNNTQEVPSISYKINEVVGSLKILRHHKIVWSILDDYCQE